LEFGPLPIFFVNGERIEMAKSKMAFLWPQLSNSLKLCCSKDLKPGGPAAASPSDRKLAGFRLGLALLFAVVAVSTADAHAATAATLSSFASRTPDRADILLNEGVDRIEQGDVKLGLRLFNEVIRKKPALRAAYVNRGITLWRLGEDAKAVQDFTTALAIHADDAKVLVYRGLANINRGAYQEALADFDRSLQLAPGTAAVFGGRGLALLGLKRNHEALENCDRAIAMGLNDPDINRARVFALTGLPAQLSTEFDGYVATIPPN
jgi:tetratricopeptide (TPR) repeat protein